jgi:hypothetical protein
MKIMWKIIFVLVVVCILLPPAAAQGELQPELEPSVAIAALDTFAAALDERWSYRYANHADFHAAIAALRKRIDRGISRDEFGIELQKIIALGIDGHSVSPAIVFHLEAVCPSLSKHRASGLSPLTRIAERSSPRAFRF